MLPWNFLVEWQNWEESLPSGRLCLVPPCLTGDYSICFDALWICKVAWGHLPKTRVFRSSRIANAKWVRKAMLFKVPQTFQALWQIQHVLHVYSVHRLARGKWVPWVLLLEAWLAQCYILYWDVCACHSIPAALWKGKDCIR